MTDTKKLIKEIDRRIKIETATLDDCPVRKHSEEWIDMLKEIKERLEKDYIHEQNIINYGIGERRYKKRGRLIRSIIKKE